MTGNDSGKNTGNNKMNKQNLQDMLRQLPKVDDVLAWAEVRPILDAYPRDMVVDGIRVVVEEKRNTIFESPF
ncbi:MAG: hypothetical protein HY779_01465 [Rubrobacteridae bacterium]|nr:hypothetical protein [Rubrobacteridae bacterium]